MVGVYKRLDLNLELFKYSNEERYEIFRKQLQLRSGYYSLQAVSCMMFARHHPLRLFLSMIVRSVLARGLSDFSDPEITLSYRYLSTLYII